MLELQFFFFNFFCDKWLLISKKNDFSGRSKCKSTIICDIGIAQCDDETVKCKKKKGITECNKSMV